ncbi:hypothetical protein B0T24DRAFT_89438 [Lasiosphaeria ovina]|uniref:Secreted protein n=1 Tax=Lasiosphaeria ovina TaxID=92902 RepID=A0AAE0NN11_9PEZI|nr:hypothetical protein B0T24DRAFT_89438 [Lasiosphaeria ovina]
MGKVTRVALLLLFLHALTNCPVCFRVVLCVEVGVILRSTPASIAGEQKMAGILEKKTISVCLDRHLLARMYLNWNHSSPLAYSPLLSQVGMRTSQTRCRMDRRDGASRRGRGNVA